ncbi:hypothetical protein BGP_0650 [Beggiatoa sp. PS]|nr:hypothetical protein BGP_0650 [Beggiatoa sp. PS]
MATIQQQFHEVDLNFTLYYTNLMIGNQTIEIKWWANKKTFTHPT